MSTGQLRVCLVVASLGAGCGLDHTLPAENNIYYQGQAEPEVLCSASVDDKYRISDSSIDSAMARAHDQRDTLHLYAHDPGQTIATAEVETVLAMATAHGVDFVTYAELGGGGPNGSLALSFDDHSVADWTAMRPLLARYHARVTFFVSLYTMMTDDEHQQLQGLAADGHDIEYHSVSHQNAPEYVAMHGLDGYLADEILPGLKAMQADGYTISAFAYPFGARTPELDVALAPYFEHLRAISSTCPRH